MKSYRLWVTTLVLQEEKIVNCLLGLRFRVEKLSEAGDLSHHNDNTLGAITAVKVQTHDKNIDVAKLTSLLESTFTDLDIKYFSLIVQSNNEDCSEWSTSNISIPKVTLQSQSPYRNY